MDRLMDRVSYRLIDRLMVIGRLMDRVIDRLNDRLLP